MGLGPVWSLRGSVDRPVELTRADRIAQMDWDALERAVAACTACELSRTRHRTVFGVGHRAAEWMLVGEAPGRRGGCAGRAVRGAGRPPARQHARRGRTHTQWHDGAVGLHRQRAEVPASWKSQSGAGRGRAVRSVPEAPDRAHQSEDRAGDGPVRGAVAAGNGRQHCQPARQGAPHRCRRAQCGCRRDVSPGLSAAQPGRQGEVLGGPLPGTARWLPPPSAPTRRSTPRNRTDAGCSGGAASPPPSTARRTARTAASPPGSTGSSRSAGRRRRASPGCSGSR